MSPLGSLPDARRHGAIDILARALAGAPDPFSLGTAASIAEHGEHGVTATIYMPSGDQYRVVVEWIGDREAEPAHEHPGDGCPCSDCKRDRGDTERQIIALAHVMYHSLSKPRAECRKCKRLLKKAGLS